MEFVHEVKTGEGYGYLYTKTLRLIHGKAQLVLEHSLKNTGKRVIDTGVYDHDFYMLDHRPTGPDFHIRFPFPPRTEDDSKDKLQSPARIEGSEIRYDRDLASGGESAHGYLSGYGVTAANNEVRVENVKAGIGVRESGDRPIYKLYFWSIRTTVCPEIYIKIHVEPGQTFKWRTSYDFYTLK